MPVIRYKVAALEIAAVEQPFATEVPMDAANVYFAPTVDIASDNVQDAIIEARAEAAATSRYTVQLAMSGTSGSGKWLECYPAISSNTSPFIIPEISQLVALTLATGTITTATTITVFKNGVAVTTISLASSKKARVVGLAISLIALDEISIQVTSGSSSNPLLNIFIKTTP